MGMEPLTIALIVLGVIALWFVFTYNRLIRLRLRAKEAVSDIDVQSKRRYDLIPNLVETVKGYATHEQGTLEKVISARNQAMNAGGGALAREGAENQLSNTLKSLFMVAEAYPDLKANANFLELQRQLEDTENKMQAARRFYNSTVSDLNTAIATFPTNLMAGAMGFAPEKFFELTSEAERQAPQVKF
jgi:LemA protein